MADGIPDGWELLSAPALSPTPPPQPKPKRSKPSGADLAPFDYAPVVDLLGQFGTVTNTARDPQHNRRVGGVENSYHLTTRPGGARALDLARAPGVSHREIDEFLRSEGFELIESLDEGDHSHFSFARGPDMEPEASPIPQGWELVSEGGQPQQDEPQGYGDQFRRRFNARPDPVQTGPLATDTQRGQAVEPLRRQQTADGSGYQIAVSPAKVAELDSAYSNGASVEDLLNLGQRLNVSLDPQQVRNAVRFRDDDDERTVGRFTGEPVGVLEPLPEDNEAANRELLRRQFGDQQISAIRHEDKTTSDFAGDFASLIGHPYPGRVEKEAKSIPFVGGMDAIEEGVRDISHGNVASGVASAAMGSLDFFPAAAPVGRFVGRGGKTIIDSEALKSVASGADGAIDAARAGDELRRAADEALQQGGTVTLHVDGKAIPITKPGLVDELGQRWGALPLLMPKAGENPRLEIDIPEAPPGSMAAEAMAARGVAEGQPQAVRQRDYLNLSGTRPQDMPQMGRTRPMGEQATPEEMAAAARNMRPEDVTPIPANAVDSLGEFQRIGDGRPLLKAPDPKQELAPRKEQSATDLFKFRNRRGPLDLSQRIRALGGLKDDGGELASMGITNAARKLEFGNDRGRGRLVHPGGSSLDEMTERLWDEGWFPHHTDRPTPDDLLDLLRQEHVAGSRVFHPNDLEEVERFNAARADAERIAEAAQEGRPLADDIGQPTTLDDLAANQPPSSAYENLPPMTGKVANLNLSKLESRTDIRRVLQNTEVRFGGFDAARRGKISHDQTLALAADLKMTVDDLLKRRKGQALNNEQAVAARQILAKSSDELVALANKARGGDDETLLAFQKALLRHAAIQEQVTGAAAEAGRSLNSFKIPARSDAARLRVMKDVIEGSGGRESIEDIAEKIIDLQRNPAKLNGYAMAAANPRMRDKLVELYYNMLLSGPQTHVVNTVSNTLTALAQIPEFAVAATIGAGRRVLPKAAAERVLFSEVGARASGMVAGITEGLTEGARVFKTEQPIDWVTKLEQRSHQNISGRKGRLIRIPSRALTAEDEFFKALARKSTIHGLAVRKAYLEGLRGEAAKLRAGELAANPTEDMMEEAFNYARYVTFQSDLGKLGKGIIRASNDMPLLKLVVPFVRTPTNLIKFAVERSPISFTLKRVRDDFRAGGARRDLAIARTVVGSSVGALVAMAAGAGLITGGGPADENAKRLLRADGWQPYSIKFGDTYVSYQRLDPFAITLGIAADFAGKGEHLTDKQREEFAVLLTTSIIQQMESKTWLSGIADLVQAVQEPERFAPAYLSRLGGAVTVPTAVAQVARVVDPVQRDTRETEGLPKWIGGPVARIKSRIPFWSKSLPPRQDMWGREMRGEGGLGPDILSPLWISKRRNDPVAKEMVRIGARFGRIQGETKGIKHTRRQQIQYERLAGQWTYEDIASAMSDPEWATLSQEDKVALVDDIKRDARADARDELGLGVPGGAAIPPGWESVPKGWEMVR